VKIALCQVNPTVGDIAGNAARIEQFAKRALEAGAEVAVFPELALIGYPPRDLLIKETFVRDQLEALDWLAKQITGLTAIIGFASKTAANDKSLHNSAAVIEDGRVAAVAHKRLLPTYDVFDEERYFQPGEKTLVAQIAGSRVAVTICEDAWNDPDFWLDHKSWSGKKTYDHDPVADPVRAGAQVIVNLSASPYSLGKESLRREMFCFIAKKYRVPVAFVNQVGGNDELVFDGRSLGIAPAGGVAAACKPFEEDMVIFDTALTAALPGEEGIGEQKRTVPSPQQGTQDVGTARRAPTGEPARRGGMTFRVELGVRAGAPVKGNSLEAPAAKPPIARIVEMLLEEEIFRALVIGTRDYVRKCGFSRGIVGLSGGIDSALVACVAAEALGPENVTGIMMPSMYSSPGSISDAQALIANLGIKSATVGISDLHQAFLAALSEVFKGANPDVTEENIQARIRGTILMAISNKFGGMLLTTGNKSEVSTGYCTLYGDMAGGLDVIGDVLKTYVYRIARWVNRDREIIPIGSLTKVPSAELRPNQTDQDTLPPYDVLDAILKEYVEEERGADEIVAMGFDPEIVAKTIRMVDAAEYKRKQAAPVLKVTGRAFGFGRRMPLAQRYRQSIPDK